MKVEAPDTLYEAATGAPRTGDKSPKALEDGQVARANYGAYLRAFDNGHKKWVEEADKFDQFYQGEQWDDETVAKLESEGRPHLTLNIVLAVINVLLGEQSTRRVDVQYRNLGPNGSGFVLTKLAMAISEANQYKYVESEVFSDGIITDRGYFDIRMDYDSNPQGDIKITSIDPREILLPPTAKDRDPSTWPEIIRSHWASLDDIEKIYGKEAAESVRSRATTGETYGIESIRVATSRFGGDLSLPTAAIPGFDEDMVIGCRLIDRQYRQLVRVFSAVDVVNNRYMDFPIGTKATEAAFMAAQLGTYAVQRTVSRIRWTVSVDEVLLFDDWSPYKTFTIIPYFPYFRRGRPLGMVRHLISPQEQFNKISSQELHIINSTANSGWTVEQGTLTNMTTDEFTEKSSATGVVIEHARGTNPPKKIQSNPVPTGLERFGMRSQSLVNEISGISNAMLGMESAEVSGVALESKERRGQIQIQLPMDNLAFTRMLVAKKQLELIKDFYRDERIVTITEGAGAAKSYQSMTINQRAADGSIQNNVFEGEYDIVISSMPDHETFDDIQFAQALALRNAGVMVPDHFVIMHSKLDGREEIAEFSKQINGFAEPTPEQAEEMRRQRELQMEHALAELDKLKAQAEELRAKAQQHLAKANDIPREEERQLRKLEQDIQKKREELDNIIQRHMITNMTKRDIAMMPKHATA